jgi:hypothetical protein
MTKTEDRMADTRALIAKGEEFIRHWDENWLSRTMSRDEIVAYYRSTKEAVNGLLRQIKPVREALGEESDTSAELAALRKRLIVVRVRAENGVRHMTEPFVPSDPERYERGLREAAEGKGIRLQT